jgi:hypothetical protein
MKETYVRKEKANGLYELLGADGENLKNHNNKPFPLLSENISRNLTGDLNAINDYNRNLIFKNNNEEDAVMEMTLHNMSNSELKESLGYCLISSLMEYEDANASAELEYIDEIQQERLFRFNPGPPLLQLEYKNTENIRAHFGDKWVNLPLNYSNSIEEMQENDSSFVTEDTINEISLLVEQMSMAQKVTVNILYNLYDFFSITIPILWVAGKIGDEEFIAASYALNNSVDIYELDEEEYEKPRFEMNRLLYLKTILYGYLWKDETLPCVKS